MACRYFIFSVQLMRFCTQDAKFQITALVSVSTNKLLKLLLTKFLWHETSSSPTPRCSAEIHLFTYPTSQNVKVSKLQTGFFHPSNSKSLTFGNFHLGTFKLKTTKVMASSPKPKKFWHLKSYHRTGLTFSVHHTL